LEVVVGHERYAVDVSSSAPPEVVFAVLVDAPAWSTWVPLVSRSTYERQGDPAPHGVGAVRRLGARLGPVSREQVVAFEEPTRFAYELRSGPLPLRGYRSEVRLRPEGQGTHISWSGSFTTRVPGLGAVMRRLMARYAEALAAEAERVASQSG
jgi:hypothetical protein